MPISKCSVCDYEWPTGQDGSHSCSQQLLARLNKVGGIDVFAICDAYESGVGHGLKHDGLGSPYKEGAHEHEAYNIGYEFGERKATRAVGDESEEHF